MQKLRHQILPFQLPAQVMPWTLFQILRVIHHGPASKLRVLPTYFQVNRMHMRLAPSIQTSHDPLRGPEHKPL